MAFDLTELRELIAGHRTVARVVIADVKGSSPREVGADVYVWATGQHGTIGGGALEFAAVQAARDALTTKGAYSDVHPLGPALGQCCGGVVRLVTEVFDTTNLPVAENGLIIRNIEGGPQTIAIERYRTDARAQGICPDPVWIDGHFIEPVASSKQPLWIWGAGHVGRALVQVMAPLPRYTITWVDTHQGRFPDDTPQSVSILYAEDIASLAQYAPISAAHVIMTYSHALDLALCDAILRRGFDFAGLIGSNTKWARFQRRLAQMGHGAQAISAITCPIGRTEFGKHPFEIAISVSSCLLEAQHALLQRRSQNKEHRA